MKLQEALDTVSHAASEFAMDLPEDQASLVFEAIYVVGKHINQYIEEREIDKYITKTKKGE
jgi:hypothetical protein